jgi:hypothetical protein
MVVADVRQRIDQTSQMLGQAVQREVFQPATMVIADVQQRATDLGQDLGARFTMVTAPLRDNLQMAVSDPLGTLNQVRNRITSALLNCPSLATPTQAPLQHSVPLVMQSMPPAAQAAPTGCQDTADSLRPTALQGFFEQAQSADQSLSQLLMARRAREPSRNDNPYSAANIYACACFIQNAGGAGIDALRELNQRVGFDLPNADDFRIVLSRYSTQVLGERPTGSVVTQLDWAYGIVRTNPCLRLLPGYDTLVERTRPIGEGVFRIASFADFLYQNRTELYTRLRDYVSRLLQTLPACGQQIWNEARSFFRRLTHSAGGVLRAVGPVLVAGFEATFLSLIDLLREKSLGEWAEQIGRALLDLIWPWPALGDSISGAFSAAGDAIGRLLRLDLGEAGSKLLDAVEGILGGVDSLGGYIYLALIGLPSLIGSLFPGPGTAAGAALGQKINSILAVVLRTISTGVDILQIFGPLGRLIDLIITKANELDEADEDEEGELPEIELTEEELSQAAMDMQQLLFRLAPSVIQLALSVLGSAAARVGSRIRQVLGQAVAFRDRILMRLRMMFRGRRDPRMPRMRMMRMMPRMMRGSDARPQCRTGQQGQQQQPGAQTPRAPQAPRAPGLPPVLRGRSRRPGSCFVAGTLVWLGTGKRIPIERVQVGDRVMTFRGATRTARELHNWQSWSKITLRVEIDGQAVSEVVLLKPQEWMAEHRPAVGKAIYLNMPEMGVQDAARVVSIEHCPSIPPGPGRVVTATFKHLGALVHQLWIKGEPRPIGVTGTHPFWSVDRQMWVEATQLWVSEQIETESGTTVVVARSALSGTAIVHNIEVEEDHCYRVGGLGLLVHNSSARGAESAPCPPHGCAIQGDLFPGLYSPPNPALMAPGALRQTAVQVHSLVTGITRNQTTVSLAEVRCNGQMEIWASGSSGNLTAGQIAALAVLGIRIVGGSSHAERNIINRVRPGATIVRWGISWGGSQSHSPCPVCLPIVLAFPPGNPTIE